MRPDTGNFSEYPYVWEEVQAHIHECVSFLVYDIIEELAEDADTSFTDEFNAYFVEEVIGWQLANGEDRHAQDGRRSNPSCQPWYRLWTIPRGTRRDGHLHEALQDLSRRPTADLSGAIDHAMGALEGVARDLADDRKETLGEVIKRNPDLLPRPVGCALPKLWGYATNEARHVREGREPNREEAELLIGLAAAMATYLTRKQTPVVDPGVEPPPLPF